MSHNTLTSPFHYQETLLANKKKSDPGSAKWTSDQIRSVVHLTQDSVLNFWGKSHKMEELNKQAEFCCRNERSQKRPQT